MEDKEIEIIEEKLKSISDNPNEMLDLRCPKCGSNNIIPFHSPSKGTAYLCCDCYRSFDKKEMEKNK